MFDNFADFREFCEMVANEQHTIVEFHEYPEYNWANATFMTDHFGGVYCSFKFDYNTCEVIDTFEKNQKPYTNYADLIIHITKEREYTEKHRNFEELSDFINSQY